MSPLNLTPPKTVDFSQVSTVKNVNLGNQYGVGGKGFNTQTPTSSTTQALTPAVGALFGLDKAAQLPLSVTSPKVGLLFGLDKAASLPMTITGNPTVNTGPTIMDLNKRSDRRLMRRYIRLQRNNGDVARNVNAWEAVRNMRRAQNGGVRWDSTGHLVQRTLSQLPTVGVPLGLLKTWDNSSAGLNTLNNLQSTAIGSTVDNLNNNFTLMLDLSTASSNNVNLPVRLSTTKTNTTSVTSLPPISLNDNTSSFILNRPLTLTQNKANNGLTIYSDANGNYYVGLNNPITGTSYVPYAGEVHDSSYNWRNDDKRVKEAVAGAMDNFLSPILPVATMGNIGRHVSNFISPGETAEVLLDNSVLPSLWSRAKNFISGLFPTNVWSTSAGTYTPSRKYGGVLKAQQGAQIQAKNSNTPTLDAIINNPQLAELFLSALSQLLGKEITLEDLTAAAANPEMGQQLEQLAQQMMKQSAKQGAKLEYISRLRGKCPEGQELVYFAKGGKICSACMGKKMEDGGEAGYMKSFRDRQKKKLMEKCGGKMKKGK